MKLSEFNFDLPAERIARFPTEERDSSKLMLIERDTGKITHHTFRDLPDILNKDEFLVMNNTKVTPARMFGKIGMARVEFLIINRLDEFKAEVFVMPAKRAKKDTVIKLDSGNEAVVIEIGERGKRILKFKNKIDADMTSGYAPLPPYLKRKYDEAKKYRKFDLERYQTLYSKVPGSIAAPTSGLHFTDKLLKKISKNNRILEITLKVGPATFQKIEVDEIENHRMGTELINIKKVVLNEIRTLKNDGNKFVAVGTTTVRSAESFALLDEEKESFESDLFIYPGFKFNLADRMITNFHLPMSSLYILVSAFAGLELIKEAYSLAISKKYRFFSFGDAMFIR